MEIFAAIVFGASAGLLLALGFIGYFSDRRRAIECEHRQHAEADARMARAADLRRRRLADDRAFGNSGRDREDR